MVSERTTSRDRVRAYRARMRAQGLRPVTFWVPDVTSPEYKAELQRQIQAVVTSPEEQDDLAFIDSLVDDLPWDDVMVWDEEDERSGSR